MCDFELGMRRAWLFCIVILIRIEMPVQKAGAKRTPQQPDP